MAHGLITKKNYKENVVNLVPDFASIILPAHKSAQLSAYLSVHLSAIFLPNCLPICLPVCLSTCLLACQLTLSKKRKTDLTDQQVNRHIERKTYGHINTQMDKCTGIQMNRCTDGRKNGQT
jgi:hypothetical protein